MLNTIDFFTGQKLRFSPSPYAEIQSETFDLYYDMTRIFEPYEDEEEAEKPNQIFEDSPGAFILVGESAYVDLQWEPPNFRVISYTMHTIDRNVSVFLPTDNAKKILKTLLKEAKKDGQVSRKTHVATKFPFFYDGVTIDAKKVTISRRQR